jgi:hypothetical protein
LVLFSDNTYGSSGHGGVVKQLLVAWWPEQGRK